MAFSHGGGGELGTGHRWRHPTPGLGLGHPASGLGLGHPGSWRKSTRLSLGRSGRNADLGNTVLHARRGEEVEYTESVLVV